MRATVYFYDDKLPTGRFMAQIIPETDGSFTAMVNEAKAETWLTSKAAADYLESAGVKMSWKSVYRIADEGEIDSSYPLPHTRRFSLSSLKAYAVRVQKDPEYWQRKRDLAPRGHR